ncbi:MAG: amidohydrolase, partial [Bacteroidales bacterium]
MEEWFDIAVTGGRVLTLDTAFTEYDDALILVKDGKIQFIGERASYPGEYRAHRVLSGSDRLILPTFFNAHTHLSISLYRGLGTDLRLHEWLEKVIWPLEKRFCTPENVYLGSCLSLLEMIRSGTGTLADMNFFSTYAAKAIEESGLRGFLGEALFSGPTPSIQDPDDGFAVTESLIERFGNHPMLQVYLVLHAPFTCSESLYHRAADFAFRHQIKVCSHVAETTREVDGFLEHFGRTPVGWLNDTGVLSPDFIAIHGVHLTGEDRHILADKGVSVIHNPHSNMILGSGICDVPDLMARGIRVGLGTDSASSNNGLSMLNELQTAAKLHKLNRLDPSVVPARDAIRMATGVNASIFGLGQVTGALSQGFSADFMMIDATASNLLPLYDPYAQIVYG